MFLSFLPALAYWYLESTYPLHIALMAGMGLAILEISVEKIFLQTVHKISWLNFYLIFILGSLSLLGDEGIWFKLQPCLTGIGVGGVILYFRYKGKSLWQDLLQEMNPARMPPPWLIQQVQPQPRIPHTFYLVDENNHGYHDYGHDRY